MNGVTEIYKDLFKNLCSDMTKEQVEYDKWLKYVQLLETAQKNNVKGLYYTGIIKTLIDAKVVNKTMIEESSYVTKIIKLKNDYQKMTAKNNDKNNDDAYIVELFDFMLDAIKNDRICYETWCIYVEMFEYALKLNIKELNYEEIIKKLIDSKVAVYRIDEYNAYTKIVDGLRKQVVQIEATNDKSKSALYPISKKFIAAELLCACEMIRSGKTINYSIWSNYVDILLTAIDYAIIGLDYNAIAHSFITANVITHTTKEIDEFADKSKQLNELLTTELNESENIKIHKK